MDQIVLSVRVKGDKNGPQTGDVILDGSAIHSWAPGEEYEKGDIFVFDDQLYRATEDFISGETFDTKHCTLIGKVNLILEEFKPDTFFVKNSLITNDSKLYKAKNDFTTGETFNLKDWDLVSGSEYTFKSEDDTVNIKLSANGKVVNFSIKEKLDLIDSEFVAVNNFLKNKVDKVEGKELSSNDFTPDYKNQLDNLDNTLETKQDKLTAGTGIDITGNTISTTAPLVTDFDDIINRPSFGGEIINSSTEIPDFTKDISDIKKNISDLEGKGSQAEQEISDEKEARIEQYEELVESISEEETARINAINTIDNKLDVNVLTDVSLDSTASTTVVKLHESKTNLKTGAITPDEVVFPVASTTQAGVMNASTFEAIEENSENIASILGGVVMTNDLVADPTQEQILAAWQTASGLTEPHNSASIWDNVNFKKYTYFTNHKTWELTQDGMGGAGIVIEPWTNTSAGIVKGSTNEGQIFAESDGTGSVNGWDGVKSNASTALAKATDNEIELATKEPIIPEGTTSQYLRGDKTWQTLDKTHVGLSNVDNTSDADKPVSTATQSALNDKQDKLTEGDNITIKDGVISATDTTYTAGTGIKIENNIITNTQTSAEWGNITGDLPNQEDLQEALDKKIEATDVSEMEEVEAVVTTSMIKDGAITAEKLASGVIPGSAKEQLYICDDVVDDPAEDSYVIKVNSLDLDSVEARVPFFIETYCSISDFRVNSGWGVYLIDGYAGDHKPLYLPNDSLTAPSVNTPVKFGSIYKGYGGITLEVMKNDVGEFIMLSPSVVPDNSITSSQIKKSSLAPAAVLWEQIGTGSSTPSTFSYIDIPIAPCLYDAVTGKARYHKAVLEIVCEPDGSTGNYRLQALDSRNSVIGTFQAGTECWHDSGSFVRRNGDEVIGCKAIGANSSYMKVELFLPIKVNYVPFLAHGFGGTDVDTGIQNFNGRINASLGNIKSLRLSVVGSSTFRLQNYYKIRLFGYREE